MRTVRRLYFYLVTLISLELIVWGLVNLLQTSLSAAPGAAKNLLASGFSLVLVGLPIFLLHAWAAQRDAARDPEERAARIRAFFHYAARFALLAPAAMNLYQFLWYYIARWVNAPLTYNSQPGANPLDNLIAIAVNALAWAALERLLRADWRLDPAGPALVEMRRLARYAWMVYSLAFALAGVIQLLTYLFQLVDGTSTYLPNGAQTLANGLAFSLVFVPLWAGWWLLIQRTCDLPGERPSQLRLGVLYLTAWVGALVLFFAGETSIQGLIQDTLNGALRFPASLSNIHNPLSAAVVFGVLWAYFARRVQAENSLELDPPRRASLRRLYAYPLALLGCAAVFAGVWQVLGELVKQLLGTPQYYLDPAQQPLAIGLAELLVGLPIWLGYWPRLQTEARLSGDAGDHARRSVLRKSYLYLIIFAGVVAVMSSAGILLYRLFNAALGNPGENLAIDSWMQARTLLVLAAWLAYHFNVLRADGQQALHALSERQAAFPVLMLQSGPDAFFAELGEILRRQAPRIPVSVQDLSAVPFRLPETAPCALVLPAALALDPPLALREALTTFSGPRVIVPLPAEGWLWAGQPPRASRDLALEVAHTLRQLAEGQSAPRAGLGLSPLAIAGLIFGGLFLLFLALIFGVNFFARF